MKNKVGPCMLVTMVCASDAEPVWYSVTGFECVAVIAVTAETVNPFQKLIQALLRALVPAAFVSSAKQENEGGDGGGGDGGGGDGGGGDVGGGDGGGGVHVPAAPGGAARLHGAPTDDVL